MRCTTLVCIAAALATWIDGCKRSDDAPTGNDSAEKSADNSAQLVVRGRRLVGQLGCTTCHSLDGSKKVASSFAGMYGRRGGPTGDNRLRDDAYLRAQIVSPSPTRADGSPSSMPSFGALDDETLDAIVAYIRSLANQPASSGEPVQSPPKDESDNSDD